MVPSRMSIVPWSRGKGNLETLREIADWVQIAERYGLVKGKALPFYRCFFMGGKMGCSQTPIHWGTGTLSQVMFGIHSGQSGHTGHSGNGLALGFGRPLWRSGVSFSASSILSAARLSIGAILVWQTYRNTIHKTQEHDCAQWNTKYLLQHTLVSGFRVCNYPIGICFASISQKARNLISASRFGNTHIFNSYLPIYSIICTIFPMIDTSLSRKRLRGAFANFAYITQQI